jgi:hypothetical protein
MTTANGQTVIGGKITLPRVGVWRADLDVLASSDDKLTGRVAVVTEKSTFVGTSIDVGSFAGRTKLRMVGGAAGMAKATKARFYHAIPGHVPVVDVLAEGGEQLSSTASSAELGAILPFWTRPAGIVSEGLEQLVDELGAAWRVLGDGSVWVGVESWPVVNPKGIILLDSVGSEGRIAIADEWPTILPGCTFRDRRVSRVEIEITPSQTRTSIWFDSGEGGGDIVRTALEGIVRQATKHLDYQTLHGARVVKQNGDDTLELRLDADHLPGMSRIPIRAGVMKLKVKQGAAVTVAFLEASPAKPCVVHVDPDGILEATLAPTARVTINAAQVVTQNGRPLARVGDMVQVISTPPGTPAMGQIMTGNNQHRG